MTDLVNQSYVTGALSEITLTTGQTTFLPTAITAISQAVRRWCGRDFTRTTYTEEYTPTYEGVVTLKQLPVNRVTAIRGNRTTALSIQNTSTSNQRASVVFTTTGDYDSGLTYTGLSLSRTSSGATTTNALTFATYTTIDTLATAINALGSGWTATAATTLKDYGSSELIGGTAALGAKQGSGAQFDVYADDLSVAQIDQAIGILKLQRYTNSAIDSPRWGPDWIVFSDQSYDNRVQVTYDAGYDTIPQPVQEACAEAIKLMFERLKTDALLSSERAGDYSYSAREAVDMLPEAIREQLAMYRITSA